MKLATYKDGSRDGQLVVVSRDLSTAHYATGIAYRLQQVLEDWNFLAPQLQDLYAQLNSGKARHAFPFDPAMCMAPLPRAFHWVGAVAYRQHAALAYGIEDAAEPPMAPGAGDRFLGPRDPLPVPADDEEMDCEAGLAVVSADLPQGATPGQALDGVRLLLLVNDVVWRRRQADERGRGFGFVLARPATAFAPVAVTPDELGPSWRGGRVHLSLHCSRNGRRLGQCDAAADMGFHFGELLAHLCRARPEQAGTIVGSGAVSAPAETDAGGHRRWPQGHACLADRRAAEQILDGQASTPYLRAGEQVRIEVKDSDGRSVFGAIEQTVGDPPPAAEPPSSAADRDPVPAAA
jgi:fumarylacetoacetate (FAA) hydrolase